MKLGGNRTRGANSTKNESRHITTKICAQDNFYTASLKTGLSPLEFSFYRFKSGGTRDKGVVTSMKVNLIRLQQKLVHIAHRKSGPLFGISLFSEIRGKWGRRRGNSTKNESHPIMTKIGA